MDLNQLKTEVENSVYSGKTDVEIVSMLNARTVDVVVRAYVNERTVIDAFADPRDGESVLLALESASASDTLLARALGWLKGDVGLDIGNASTRAIIDTLVTASVLTQVQADTIKNLAVRTVSRASELNLGTVKVRHIEEARAING